MIEGHDYLIHRTTTSDISVALYDTIGTSHLPCVSLPWQGSADDIHEGIRALLLVDTPLAQIVAGLPDDTGHWIIGVRTHVLPTDPGLMPLVQAMARAAQVAADNREHRDRPWDPSYVQLAAAMLPALMPLLRLTAHMVNGSGPSALKRYP